MSVSSQEAGIDEVYEVWAAPENSTINRLDAACTLSQLYFNEFNSEDKALPIITEALEIAREIKNDSFLCKLTLNLGIYYGFKGDFHKAHDLLKESLDYALTLQIGSLGPEFNGGAINYLVKHLAWTFGLIGEIENMAEYFNEVMPQIERMNMEVGSLGMVYARIADAYATAGKFPEAVYWSLKAVSWYEKMEDESLKRARKALRLSYIGNYYTNMESFSMAKKYIRESITMAKDLRDTSTLLESQITLAKIELGLGNYQQALSNIDSILALENYYEQRSETQYYTVSHFGYKLPYQETYRAKVLIFLDRPEEAIPILLKSLEIFEKEPAKKDWAAYTCAQLGMAFLKLKQYKKATIYAERGLRLANGLQKETKENFEVLYKAHEALGQKAEAFDAYKGFITYRDSIVSVRNAEELTRLELEKDFQQERYADSLLTAQMNREREMVFEQQLTKERSNRNLLTVSGSAAILFALGLYLRLRHIRRTKKELQEKNRIINAERQKARASEQAKQQFLANMSHEIRTPMNAIKGMTDILLRRKLLPEQLTYLSAIKESSDGLLVVINDILDISKVEAGKIELEQIPFSPAKVIQNIHTIMQLKADEKGIGLHTEIDENFSGMVLGDPTRLHQIILNLTGNAIKFTEKGSVQIQLKDGQIENGRRILQFCISDTGIGIDKDHLDKIFASFEQANSDTTRKFGGTGLGLSISKKLVELQNGRIWVESQKGKGSQFYFTIPFPIAELKELKEDLKEGKQVEEIARELSGIKVLLVEDNAFNATVAQEELEDAIDQVKVTLAENGENAIQQVKSGNFDLILMDVQMPVMNGYEATSAIRQLESDKANIPIIAMTANVLKEEIDRCFKSGMNDFIGKPFDTSDLLLKIHSLVKFLDKNI